MNQDLITRTLAERAAVVDERPPDLDLLHARVAAATRRRQVAGVVVAAAAVAALSTTAAALSLGDGAHPPVQQPSPTETPSTAGEWTPERTRAEGSPAGFLEHRSGPAPSGLDAHLYCAAQATPAGSPCDSYHPYDPEEDQHWAMEVTQGGRSALFEVWGTPIARDFDEDSILVQDGTAEAVRYRLLQADGTAVQLRLVSDPAPAVPGPDVMLIQDLATYRRGSFGPDGPGERPYVVDDGAGTLQPLDVPQEVEWWGPNVDESLWGGDGCRVIWQRPDGGFDHHDTDCLHTVAPTDPGWNWGERFADWLEPGRMALVEHDADGSPLAVHASLDHGATWERIDVEDRDWDGTSDQIGDALVDALGQLD